jgi:hypothetical protein
VTTSTVRLHVGIDQLGMPTVVLSCPLHGTATWADVTPRRRTKVARELHDVIRRERPDVSEQQVATAVVWSLLAEVLAEQHRCLCGYVPSRLLIEGER